MDVPEVRYAHRAGRAIAYQCFGAGPIDVLGFSEWAGNCDSVFEHPGHVRLWRFHATIARTIRFDRSGIGSSDAPDDLTDVGEWVADTVAVLDDVGASRVTAVAEGWAGHTAVALAMTHPERVDRLVLINSYARLTQTNGYDVGLEIDDLDRVVDVVRANWGTGQVIASSTPMLGEGYLDLCARYERCAASPNVAAAMVRASYLSDIRPLLANVDCPVLVLHTGQNRWVPSVHAKYLHEHIGGSELLEVRGETYNDLTSEGMRTYLEFVAGDTEMPFGDRELAVVVMSDMVGSTDQLARRGDRQWKELLETFDSVVEREVRRVGGRVVKQTGDGHLLTFSTPGVAIAAVFGMRRAAHAMGIALRFGVHIGEIEIKQDGDIAGIAVHTVARIASTATADQVLVSRGIADLVDGTGLTVTDAGVHELRGLPAPVPLFAISG